MGTAGKKCFVIMPFGIKPDPDDKSKTIDFDEIYKHLIKKTVDEELKMTCVRCDMIDNAGWIHKQMFEQIHQSDVAVVDLTLFNPNVLYELGIRHTLSECVTVLICKESTVEIPFNLKGIRIIMYNPASMASVDTAKESIAEFIRNGLDSRKNDSPVREVLNIKIESPKPTINIQEKFTYQLPNNKKIGLITGDLRNVRGIDIWVNSENTNMQMARFFDRSVSSTIRYLGAEKDDADTVTKDIIADELKLIMGQRTSVAPGAILVTGAGALGNSNNVRKIFHAAAVQGQLGVGYEPIKDIGECVRNAIRRGDDVKFAADDLRSILFPIMGTGVGQGDLEQKAGDLINAAISQLVLPPPPCRIDEVYFLARTEKDLDVCTRIIQKHPLKPKLVKQPIKSNRTP